MDKIKGLIIFLILVIFSTLKIYPLSVFDSTFNNNFLLLTSILAIIFVVESAKEKAFLCLLGFICIVSSIIVGGLGHKIVLLELAYFFMITLIYSDKIRILLLNYSSSLLVLIAYHLDSEFAFKLNFLELIIPFKILLLPLLDNKYFLADGNNKIIYNPFSFSYILILKEINYAFENSPYIYALALPYLLYCSIRAFGLKTEGPKYILSYMYYSVMIYCLLFMDYAFTLDFIILFSLVYYVINLQKNLSFLPIIFLFLMPSTIFYNYILRNFNSSIQVGWLISIIFILSLFFILLSIIYKANKESKSIYSIETIKNCGVAISLYYVTVFFKDLIQ